MFDWVLNTPLNNIQIIKEKIQQKFWFNLFLNSAYDTVTLKHELPYILFDLNVLP